MLVRVVPSTRKTKKYAAVFSDGSTTHFGARGYGDYTVYWKRDRNLARKKRASYIARHGATEDWSDPRAAGTLSRYILWEHPTLNKAVSEYKKRFYKS
jgi:hypothetical protein